MTTLCILRDSGQHFYRDHKNGSIIMNDNSNNNYNIHILTMITAWNLYSVSLREENKSERAPFYMVEVFTKPGTNSEWCKQHIMETTGFIPAIYDKGTHCVTNMRLTLDILKRLDDFEFVEEVTGDYTGTLTGIRASHEHRKHRE